MSRRSGALLLALLLLAFAGELGAQATEHWRDSALLLATKVRALRDSLYQGDSTIQEVARRGDLLLGATEKARPYALQAFERFARVTARWFGSARPSPAGFRIIVRGETEGDWRDSSPELRLAGLPDSSSAARRQHSVRRNGFAAGLIDAYAGLMYEAAGPGFGRWLELPPPLSMDADERGYIAMYALVTGTGRAQRDCVAGKLAECAYALRLRPASTPNPGGTYAPFLRHELMLKALELGGAGAWSRLQEAASTGAEPEAALAAAAAMPSDSLLEQWRKGLLALRPPVGPLVTQGALLAAAWAALLLLGALGASRWA